MLRDGAGTPGRGLRHPRRRPRSRLPAPRERDRAEPLRPRHRGDGAPVDAQRLRSGERREDVEVARQLLHRAATAGGRSEEHTSELQSLMRISYAGFCLKKKKNNLILDRLLRNSVILQYVESTDSFDHISLTVMCKFNWFYNVIRIS